MPGMQNKKLGRFSVWPWFIVATTIILIIGSWLLKLESSEAEKLKTELQAAIIEQIGKNSNMNKERIADISISRNLDGWNVEISLNADKGFTMVSTKLKMWQDAIAVLEPLSEINQLNDISFSWIYPVENSQNKLEDTHVMSFRVDKATRNQLIWDNVEPSILPDIVFDYQEHPVLDNRLPQ